MLKEYQIENFKAFADTVTIPIRPLTLIFGANSSGKSAVLQSLLMLKQSLNGTEPLTPKGRFVDLGSFENLVHGHDTQNRFSFKMTFDARSGIRNVVPSISQRLRDDTKKLFEITDLDIMGLSVQFDGSKGPSLTVSGVELFLGQEPKPIISYSKGPLRGILFPEDLWDQTLHAILSQEKDEEEGARRARAFSEAFSGYLVRENRDHPFWNKYRDKFPEKADASHDYLRLKAFLPDSLNNNDWETIVFAGDLESHDDFKSIRSADDHSDFEATFLADTPRGDEDARNISVFTLLAAKWVRSILGGITHIPPLRDYPKRYYTEGESANTDRLLKRAALSRLNQWLAKLKINYELQIDPFFSQSGNPVGLYGLLVKNRISGVVTGIEDIGFGVSQVYPVVLESLHSKEAMILVQQPELHLHPALQAELGDMFIESALGDSKNTFIIETHSEHILLRIMRRIRETSSGKLPERVSPLHPEDVMVLFVEPEGPRSVVHEMPMNEKGDLVKPWPGGFFEEGFKELF